MCRRTSRNTSRKLVPFSSRPPLQKEAHSRCHRMPLPAVPAARRRARHQKHSLVSTTQLVMPSLTMLAMTADYRKSSCIVAAICSLLQCIAVCCSALQDQTEKNSACTRAHSVCCSVLQCITLSLRNEDANRVN